MWLDVGCGVNQYTPNSVPQGDVNCDILKPLRKVSNFVLCDAQHLPFKNGAFSFVSCNHVIEHVDNPFQALKEMLRVSNYKIVIRTPYKLQRAGIMGKRFGNSSPDNHRCHFNEKWFAEALKKLGVTEGYTIKYSSFKCLPHQFMPIIRFPTELTIKIRKKTKIPHK